MQVSGYENYLVFEDGFIMNSKTGRQIIPWEITGGYLQVQLCKNGISKNFLVSRLVALAYIENPENKPQADHINRIRNDNRLENLQWSTLVENAQNKGMMITNTSGEKYISQIPSGKYIFKKTTNGKFFSKLFKTKAEAIIFRDNFLSNL